MFQRPLEAAEQLTGREAWERWSRGEAGRGAQVGCGGQENGPVSGLGGAREGVRSRDSPRPQEEWAVQRLHVARAATRKGRAALVRRGGGLSFLAPTVCPKLL